MPLWNIHWFLHFFLRCQRTFLLFFNFLIATCKGEGSARSFSWCRRCLITWRAANFRGDNFIFISFTRRLIPVGDRSAADLFVLWLVFEASRSGEVMISPFAFQVRSLQRLVKLETDFARRTACRAQVNQLRSEKLSPSSRGNRSDSNDCASTTQSWPLSTSKVLFLETPKTGTIFTLLPEIKDFLQKRQWGSRSISLFSEREKQLYVSPQKG